MAFTQKYTIVQFIDSIADGTAYPCTEWPLHVTLADVFAVDWSASELIAIVEQVVRQVKPFQAVTQWDTHFGPSKEVQVTLLEKCQPLIELHTRLVAALRPGNVRFNAPQYTLDGFTPHATVQHAGRLYEGDVVTFSALNVIDMFPGGDPYQRVALGAIPFGRV